MECGEGEFNRLFDVFLLKYVGFWGGVVKAGFAVKARGFIKVQSGELGFCGVRSEKLWDAGRVGENLLCFLELLGVKGGFYALTTVVFFQNQQCEVV